MADESGTEYAARMNELAETVTTVHDIDLFAEKDTDVTPPPPAQSEFLINKEQGDWAEQLVKELLNRRLPHHTAVEYGRGEDRVSGEPGFEEYYRAYHRELADIGKCPDLLLFETDTINHETINEIENIEDVPRRDLIETIRPAVAGLEVRSSSYLVEKYNHDQTERQTEVEQELDSLTTTLSDLFQKILDSPDVEDPERLRTYVDRAKMYAEASNKAEAPTYYTRAPIKRMAKTNLSDPEANTFLEAAEDIRNIHGTVLSHVPYIRGYVPLFDSVLLISISYSSCNQYT